MDTVNRGWLKKQVELGNIEAKCNIHLTDDYAFDNANGFGKTEWMPARIRTPKWETYTNHVGNEQTRCVDSDVVDGSANFFADDFKTKSGRAYRSGEGLITFRIHGNEVWTLKVKAL